VNVTHEFDDAIQVAVALYLDDGYGWDWRKTKAQLLQESRLNPKAVSPAGAQGIAQMMPGTWPEVRRGIGAPADASPFEPRFAIPGCCWYMRLMLNNWSANGRSVEDRHNLALASYNAGLGNMLAAQKRASGAVDYDTIMHSLPYITGLRNSQETHEYVVRINAYFAMLRENADFSNVIAGSATTAPG
jgi:soluble lytic murein transglycosylase-like protein